MVNFLSDGEALPSGTRIEAITPRGEVAGCFTVTTPGEYGFLTLFGADEIENGLPGFLSDEPVTLRVNGVIVPLVDPFLWQNDKLTHALDLVVDGAGTIDLYLPYTNR